MSIAADPNRLLKPEEAALLLGLQPCTLAAWREAGSMPMLAFFKIGRAVRYRYADVVAFIETRRATNTVVARRLPRPTRRPQQTQVQRKESERMLKSTRPATQQELF